jgi:hypothetical protein
MGIGTGLTTFGMHLDRQTLNDEKYSDEKHWSTVTGKTFPGAGDGNRTRVISLEG